MLFTPNRPLLNPQFEGYKLNFSPSPQLSRVPLEHGPTQSRAGIHALGFEEMASRVRHNHLAVAEALDNAVYIADDGSVILIADDSDAHAGVSLNVVYRLPQHTAATRAEYPAAAYLTQNVWLISDGCGYTYLLRIDSSIKNVGATVLATWQLRTGEDVISFQLHAVGIVEGLPIAILSSLSSPHSSCVATRVRTTFDIWAVRVPIPDSPLPDVMNDNPSSFDVVWRRRGTHIPLFVKYVTEHNSFLLLGGSSYHDLTSSPVPNPYDPSSDEFAPIPRMDEALDAPAPPSYSWTQTDDSVTVAFAIPGTTDKTSITTTFGAHTLSLHVGSPPLSHPHYTTAPLWDAIRPDSSLWTWECGDYTKAGLLTLYLDKSHPGTRWSHVFTQGFEADVAETLDPSELSAIRESLNKYTAALQDGASDLGHGVPSLAEGERDNDVDANIGKPVMLTWVDADGGSNRPADDTPATLLSQPLPGVLDRLTLVIKSDIDGPLYTLGDARTWTHTATYPALAFVLASKRDTRFTFHVGSTVAVAFESGARDGGGNVYSYRGSAPGDRWARQNVFHLQAGVGALLGVGAITSKAGRKILLCLSEHELTTCRDLF